MNALGKIAAVVHALRTQTRMARVAEVTKLSGTTVHRIMHGLKEVGWVRQTEDGQWWLEGRAPGRRATEDEVVQVVGDALSEWCTGMGWPFSRTQALRPYGAARAIVTALQGLAKRGGECSTGSPMAGSPPEQQRTV